MPREELHAMGLRGSAWMLRDFSWNRIAFDMQSVYEWVLGRGERPSTVHLN